MQEKQWTVQFSDIPELIDERATNPKTTIIPMNVQCFIGINQ